MLFSFSCIIHVKPSSYKQNVHLTLNIQNNNIIFIKYYNNPGNDEESELTILSRLSSMS